MLESAVDVPEAGNQRRHQRHHAQGKIRANIFLKRPFCAVELTTIEGEAFWETHVRQAGKAAVIIPCFFTGIPAARPQLDGRRRYK